MSSAVLVGIGTVAVDQSLTVRVVFVPKDE